MDEEFEVVFHHGGKFISDGKLRYEYGETTRLSFDPDMWSYFVVLNVIKGMGYVGENKLWFSVGGSSVLDDKLQLLCDDSGVLHMVNIARLNGEVLFVEHSLSEPQVIEMLEYYPDEPETQEEGEPQAENQSVPVAVDDIGCEGECDVEIREVGTEADIGGVLSDGLECEAEGEDEIRDDGVQYEVEGDGEIRDDGVQCEVEGDAEMREDGVDCEVQGDGELRDVEVNCEPQPAGEMREDLRDVEVTKEVAEDVGHTKIEEDGDVHSWTESGPDDSMDESADNLLDVNIDCDIDDELRHKEWSGNVEVEVESGPRGQSTACGPQVNQSYDTDVEDDVRGLSDNEWIFDEYMSDVVDSDDEGYGNFRTFTMPKAMTDYKWEVGTYFTEKEELLEAIKCYALENGRNIKFVKNDKRRVRLRCIGGKGKCPWTAYCGYIKAIKT